MQADFLATPVTLILQTPSARSQAGAIREGSAALLPATLD